MMFPVTFRTIPVYADGSVDEARKEGQQRAYAQGETAQEAEDTARAWLGDLSETARVYTPEGKPRRKLGPVISSVGAVVPARKLHAGHFVIYRDAGVA